MCGGEASGDLSALTVHACSHALTVLPSEHQSLHQSSSAKQHVGRGFSKKDALGQARDTEIYDVPVEAEMIANILL